MRGSPQEVHSSDNWTAIGCSWFKAKSSASISFCVLFLVCIFEVTELSIACYIEELLCGAVSPLQWWLATSFTLGEFTGLNYFFTKVEAKPDFKANSSSVNYVSLKPNRCILVLSNSSWKSRLCYTNSNSVSVETMLATAYRWLLVTLFWSSIIFYWLIMLL